MRIDCNGNETKNENTTVAMFNNDVYYISANKYGEVFDPTEHKLSKTETGDMNFSLKRTTKSVFDSYVSFLRTKNRIYMDFARREFYSTTIKR